MTFFSAVTDRPTPSVMLSQDDIYGAIVMHSATSDLPQDTSSVSEPTTSAVAWIADMPASSTINMAAILAGNNAYLDDVEYLQSA